jgi:hypothetical protein
VRDLDAATAEALGYLRSFRPDDVRPVIPTKRGAIDQAMQADWRTFAGTGIPDLIPLKGHGLFSCVRAHILTIPRAPDDFITVIVPETLKPQGLFRYVLRSRDLIRLKASLLRIPNVVVTDAPVVVSEGSPMGVDAKPLIPQRTVSLVFVSAVSDVSIRAVNYARSLDATETRAIYFDMDTEQMHTLERDWFDAGLEVPLDIVEAPFRDLTTPMLQEVRRYTERRDTVVNVIVPEYIVSKWWQLPLHNQTALFVKRLFLMEERTLLTSVPYALGTRSAKTGEHAVV